MSVLALPTAQVWASDPDASVFVTANAGSGKTSTLVRRVARLLLRGARPEAILCVTYTKAAAAEMQRRLFQELGAWAVMPDHLLAEKLADLAEAGHGFSTARALFARALETPGGLKIQTIHAFCEKLLRRFPLEAGISPGFAVLEDAAARRVSAEAREDVARFALADPDSAIGAAYAHFSVELDYQRFNAMLATFEARRRDIARYVEARESHDGYGSDIWRRCGFERETPPDEIERQGVARIRWGQWRRAAEALGQGNATDKTLRANMLALDEDAAFNDVWALFSTKEGAPRKSMAGAGVEPWAKAWLLAEQARFLAVVEEAAAARVARDSVYAISLAIAYSTFYEAAKARLRALDFGDLIERTHDLLTARADAAWVLFKLDGGLDHVLLDEAQDTAPDQWDILRALTGEFFTGLGAARIDRTLFAVGDEKQSIFSFQGAAPERFAAERHEFEVMVRAAGQPFRHVALLESWRSAPEVLTFVDAVFQPPEAAAGLRPLGAAAFPIKHQPRRDPGGSVQLWPLEETDEAEAVDPWAPVDQEPVESANKKLARRIAKEIKAMVERGEAVQDRATGLPRPTRYGDVLILVRRRNALFHEIIRALKTANVPVGGADRLKLSEHAAFQDLLGLGRFARFPGDDLTLAALLRSPFCDIDEISLFDLAHGRRGTLWGSLRARARERPEWGAAVRFFGWALGEAKSRTPFDFYARLLSRLDETGASMKRRILGRMGREAEDALDAFLAEALAAERRGVVEMERFIADMAASEIEVKREQEDSEGQAVGEVRVMTAHGAKGLEAPIVILPDTTTRATSQGGPLLDAEGGGFLWAPRKADDCPASAAARAARDTASDHESLRLLYVALTRARDRLIICGVKVQDQFFEGSWRDLIVRAFDQPEIAGAAGPINLEDGAVGVRFGPAPQVLSRPAPEPAGLSLPDWATRLAPAEPGSRRAVSPSRLGEDSPSAAPSPLSSLGGLGRYRRGDLVHRLLQLLPDVPVPDRANAARRLLRREIDLTDDQRAEMAGAALGVLSDPQFADVFGPGSRAEVALAGAAAKLPPGIAISGRVDRLLVTPERVLVIDFKSNRPSPDRIEDADVAYITQMAVYWAVLAEIFPGRRIEAALVWTDGPKLMPVPEKLLAQALDALA